MTSSDTTTEDPAFDASTFYVVGGTLATDAPSYVTRQADHQLREALLRGDFCYVLDTRQVGKSSLMVRAALLLKQQGVAVGILDLTRLGQSLNPEQWYYGLLLNLGAQLGLRNELRDYWQQNRELGPLQRWMEALRQVALPSSSSPDSTPQATAPRSRLVIFIDEIDNVLNLPFHTDEFFAAIRECYTRRAHDAEMGGLTFCLLGSTTPNSLIQDVRTTPFNIGLHIEPTDFSLTEAAPLKEGIERHLSGVPKPNAVAEELLERVLYWTGGHPYLTQRLCRAVMEAISAPDSLPGTSGEPIQNPKSKIQNPTPALVDRLCAELFFTKSAREAESNLTFVSNRILKSGADPAALLDLLKQIHASKPVKNEPGDPLCAILRLSGMVRVVDGILVIRNRIYRKVFDIEWIRANMPDAEWRRQRAAFRRGQLRAAGGFGLVGIALVLSLLTLAANQNAAISRAHAQNLKIALDQEQRALATARQEKVLADEAAQTAARAVVREKAARSRSEYLQGVANQRSEDAMKASREAKANLKLAVANEQRARLSAAEAHQSAREATRARMQLAAQLRENERFIYPARIQLADQAIQRGEVVAARDDLQRCNPSLRGFEWRMLYEQCRDLSFQTIQTHLDGVSAIASCPGSRLIASIGREGMPAADSNQSPDGRLTLWSATTGKQVAGINSPAFWSYRVTFSPDGSRLAATEGDGILQIWDVATLKLLRNIRVDSGGRGLVAAFSPDAKTVATGNAAGTIQLWNAATGQLLTSLEAQNAPVNQLQFSPDGHTLAVAAWGAGDSVAKLFDVRNGSETLALGRREEMNGYSPAATCLAFSPDSRFIAIGCRNQTAYIWQVSDGELRCRLSAHQGEFTAMAFSPDGRLLATGGDDDLIRIWDATTLENSKTELSQITTLSGHTAPIRSLAFRADSKTLATAGQDGAIKEGNLQELVVARYKAGGSAVRAVVYSADGRLLARIDDPITDRPAASRTSLSPFRLYDAATLQEIQVMQTGDTKGFTCAAFSPDARLIATAGTDRTVQLWDTLTGRQVGDLHDLREQVLTLAFSPDGKLLATGGQGNRESGYRVRLWDVQAQEQIGKMDESCQRAINTLAFSPDGKLLVTGDQAGDLRWWDVARRKEILQLPGARPVRGFDGILTLAFAPDGKWLATGGGDDLIRIWNVAARRTVAVLRGHTGHVLTLAYSPDGHTLASGSADGTIKFWVPNSERAIPRQEAISRQMGQRGVESLAFAPDGAMLTSGYQSGLLLFTRAADLRAPARLTQTQREER